MRTEMWVTKPVRDRYYVAERIKGYKKLVWSYTCVKPIHGFVRIEPTAVPFEARKQIYRQIERSKQEAA